MRRLCLALLTLGLVGCDDGAGSSCVLDSDCPDFMHACIDGTCRPAGSQPDSGATRMDGSGPTLDAGSGMDASGPTDAGEPVDAEPADAEPTDAEPMDAEPTDAAMPACDTPPTDWAVAFVSDLEACGGATAGSPVTITADSTAACTFVATSLTATAITGTFTLDESGSVAGAMSPGVAGEGVCSGSYNAGATLFSFVCGACVMNLSAP